MKKILFILRKVLFLDELLALLYGGLAIAGIFLIAEKIDNKVVMAIALIFYLPAVAFFGVWGAKKFTSQVKDKHEQ